MKRIFTGIALVAVTAFAIYMRGYNNIWFGIFAALICFACVWELTRALSDRLSGGFKAAAFTAAAVYLPVYIFTGLSGVAVFCALAFAAGFVIMAFSPQIKAESLGFFAVILFYPVLILALLTDLGYRSAGVLPLVMIFVTGPAADTMAFAVGSVLKGKKLCPAISPNKTVSGFIGGVAGGIIAAGAIYFAFNGFLGQTDIATPSLAAMLIIGLIGSFVTVVGDLAESSLKRRLGIKDFGNLLPGHGGMLDRIDSTLFNTIYYFIVFTYIFPVF